MVHVIVVVPDHVLALIQTSVVVRHADAIVLIPRQLNMIQDLVVRVGVLLYVAVLIVPADHALVVAHLDVIITIIIVADVIITIVLPAVLTIEIANDLDQGRERREHCSNDLLSSTPLLLPHFPYLYFQLMDHEVF